MFVVASRALNPIMLIHLLGYCNSVSGDTLCKENLANFSRTIEKYDTTFTH